MLAPFPHTERGEVFMRSWKPRRFCQMNSRIPLGSLPDTCTFEMPIQQFSRNLFGVGNSGPGRLDSCRVCRQKSVRSKVTRAEDVMHLAVVACGNRLEETLTMVKSALLFSIKKIKFHIFAEEDLTEQFEKGFNDVSDERWEGRT
ncbi:hypothetical protein NFI96_003540 [Prochilodus magdalenae]|nr:hypothetical protein NFI96_003540 [Prochilodus magdalenae]